MSLRAMGRVPKGYGALDDLANSHASTDTTDPLSSAIFSGPHHIAKISPQDFCLFLINLRK